MELPLLVYHKTEIEKTRAESQGRELIPGEFSPEPDSYWEKMYEEYIQRAIEA